MKPRRLQPEIQALPASGGALWLALLLFAAVVGLALLATPPLALSAERVTVPGHDVAIYDLAGQVKIEPGSGSDVEVEIERGGRDAGQLKVATGTIGDRQTLRILYPGRRVIYPWLHFGSSTNLDVRPDGTFGNHHGFGFNRVTIASGGRGIEAHADLVVRVPEGHHVELHLAVGPVNANDVHGDLSIDTSNGPVECSGTKGQLKVDTGSGSVRVHGAEGDLVSVDTGSGGVVAEEIAAGTLHLDTGSGSVEIGNARAKKIDVDTGSGGVKAEGIRADQVHIDTGSGRVSLGLDQNPNHVEIDTGSGGVLVRVPSDYTTTFDLESGSGGVDVGAEHTVTYHDHGTMRGTIGNGSGTLHVDTGSGGIQITPTHSGHAGI